MPELTALIRSNNGIVAAIGKHIAGDGISEVGGGIDVFSGRMRNEAKNDDSRAGGRDSNEGLFRRDPSGDDQIHARPLSGGRQLSLCMGIAVLHHAEGKI